MEGVLLVSLSAFPFARVRFVRSSFFLLRGLLCMLTAILVVLVLEVICELLTAVWLHLFRLSLITGSSMK